MEKTHRPGVKQAEEVRKHLMKNTLRIGAVAAVSALALAACSSAPEDEATTSTSGAPESSATAAPAVDFLPCMVSDTGGFDDNSFNEIGYTGLKKAADELGVEPIAVESASDADFAPNLQSLADQGCDLIVSVGFLLSAATVEAALANPDVEFAIIDDAADNDFDGTIDAPNIKPILFDTVQAGFLAGYAAASYSKTGVIGTFGGMQFGSVSIFMDGFAEGAAYYNEVNGTTVAVKGWDVVSQTGTFTGGFEANDTAKQTAQGLIDQNADVLFPVGGPIYLSAIEAVKDSGKDIVLVGVDADLTQTDPANASFFLTSVLKGMDAGVYDVVTKAAAGEFDTTPYVGTLENGGVGLAPFHDFESKVDPELAAKIEELKAGIIDGSVPATSVSSPVK